MERETPEGQGAGRRKVSGEGQSGWRESELKKGWYLGAWAAGGLGNFPLEGGDPKPFCYI